ncbi:MAG: hypothetical protein M1832_003252 [Thelocarpon impressellum]|nr:MAG: hypothetical protein M1832_003252 [Thelocarpon impressellum]
MGNVSSRPDDGAALYMRDQARLSIAALTITNPRRRVLFNIAPNAFPATKVVATRDASDDSIVNFVQVGPASRAPASSDTVVLTVLSSPQDPESSSINASPSYLLRVDNDDELEFKFSFIIRQPEPGLSPSNETVDTVIQGLTFAFASTSRELDNLVTREFHADPNFHRNSNVQLVGDYSTGGSSSVQLDWTWKWQPPKPQEDKGGGWRTSCSVRIQGPAPELCEDCADPLQFLEYDQRAHRLNTLTSFSFWVQSGFISRPVAFDQADGPPDTQRIIRSPHYSPVPGFEMKPPPRIRVASAQSIDSRLSVGPDVREDPFPEPPSPNETLVENGSSAAQSVAGNLVRVDVSCQRPGEDMSAVEDGPLFRATMKAMEQKTGNMRTKMKKVLKKAEAVQQAQVECNSATAAFMDSLREASVSNANAIQPALEHYFEKIAREILQYEKQNTISLQKLIIDPITKLYTYDIKQAEAKKRDFEDESRDYYAYVGRYLGQRQDSLKEKKRAESDSKYQTKRRNFELKRFDYSSFMQDLHGGRKEQEVLSHLTRFADAQAKSFLAAAKKIEEMVPQLEALSFEVKEADKEYQFHRTEREEKRRILEKSTKTYVEPESTPAVLANPVTPANTNGGGYVSDSELARTDSSASNAHTSAPSAGQASLSPNAGSSFAGSSLNSLTGSPGTQSSSGIPSRGKGSDKFKGIRDLEERDHSQAAAGEKSRDQQRKEGLLWALSRPGSHVDPKGLNKQAWHKFWIVLDQGKLSEYSNWKQKLDLHMEPIDLRMASVREARSAERRFCFEVITPQYKRVYQATSEDDMNTWISAINNALQSAVEGRGTSRNVTPSGAGEASARQDIRSALTGKFSATPGHSHSTGHASHHHGAGAPANSVFRRTTVGARPTYLRSSSSSFEENPSKLLQIVRDADQGNCWCADCGSGIKTEWVSINLGIILCIECSGIHRSLGTHITKIRSLTLDTTSFTTDIVELLLQVGNRVSNMIWEAKLDPAQKPSPAMSREQRLKFITAKYVDKEYVAPLSPTTSRYATADEALVASVKQNDVQGVLYALALGGSPNATDLSRATHAVFLALAAADPAPISGASPVASPVSPKTPATAFPIAELLVQNGAMMPGTMPAFPLSRSALQYVEQKSGREASAKAAGGIVPGGADTLGALPAFGSASVERDKMREREARLQKRVSASARLARPSEGKP